MLVSILLFTFYVPQAFQSIIADKNEDLISLASESVLDVDLNIDWEYEPRVWSPDEVDLIKEDDFFHDHQDFSDNILVNEKQQLGVEEVDNRVNKWDQEINPHKKHYFLNDPNNVKITKRQKQETEQEQEEKCTQFRVDTREAIVCDKTRCDKFDFEWPKYDNQLAIIETTKHGMRFHRTDFAFAQDGQFHFDRESIYSGQEKISGNNKERIKLDILEIFKPKPPQTTTTTSTTPAPDSVSSTTQQNSASSTTTQQLDEDRQTTTTSINDNHERDAEISSQDSNTTKLVTTFRLDTRRVKQKIIGFGGALSDSTCRNIKSLSPSMARSLMEDYYGDRGLKYNIARLSIGSSDFSTTPYTNNDRVESSYSMRQKLVGSDEKDDIEMNNFRLVSEDYEYKLPIARQAIATSRQELKFFASMWSPPIWMKNNSHIVHGYLKGDIYGPYYKALAELMIKWLEAYKKNGINFWAMTGLNEPITGTKPFIFHNSLGISREDYVTFFKLYLGPMMRQRGLSDIKLLMLDDNKGYAPNYVKLMLEDTEVSKYISGIAIHWYMNDEYENLNFISKYYPDKFILPTEACNGFLPFQVHAMPGNWDRGVAYMYDIIKTIQKSAAGWVDWNMALDLTGGPSWIKNNLDSPIIVNSKRDEYYKSPMFYAIGHFSRFVEPDSRRLDFRLANAKYDYPFEAVGFYTPKAYIVIVVLNANRYPVHFKIIVDKQLVRVVKIRADSFTTIVFKWKQTGNQIIF